MMAQTAEDSPAAAALLTCNGTDALLQVKYTITEDGWTSGFVSYKYPPFLKLQGNMVRFYKTYLQNWQTNRRAFREMSAMR